MRRSWFPCLTLALTLLSLGGAYAQARLDWRASTPAEQALDATAFAGIGDTIAKDMADVQSAVVVLRGRVVFSFYRDGNPDTLHKVHSIAKSALASLVGAAIGEGRIANVDLPVLSLMPEWAPHNDDPRAARITLRHLLTMTAGFEVNDPSGTAPAMSPARAWARPLRHVPGEFFAYDNSLVPMLSALIERATGMPLADYARRQLVAPMEFAEPDYRGGLSLRTLDMAKLGQLYLQDGRWGDLQLVPQAFVAAASRQQNAGGLPVSLPYGYLWWVVPSNNAKAVRNTFFASGFGGQMVWVFPPGELVVVVASAASPESARRGQALQLVRNQLFAAARQRASVDPR